MEALRLSLCDVSHGIEASEWLERKDASPPERKKRRVDGNVPHHATILLELKSCRPTDTNKEM